MENNKLIDNPVDEAERPLSRSHASGELQKDGPIEVPRDSIVSIFERVAAANPDRIATVCGNVSHTYGALNFRANCIARHLRELGVRAEQLPDFAAKAFGIQRILRVNPRFPSQAEIEAIFAEAL